MVNQPLPFKLTLMYKKQLDQTMHVTVLMQF